MSSKFNRPFSENKHPRPIITPRAKEVWLAASLRMYEHYKEHGVEQYAVCYLQMPQPRVKNSWGNLFFELEEEEE